MLPLQLPQLQEALHEAHLDHRRAQHLMAPVVAAHRHGSLGSRCSEATPLWGPQSSYPPLAHPHRKSPAHYPAWAGSALSRLKVAPFAEWVSKPHCMRAPRKISRKRPLDIGFPRTSGVVSVTSQRLSAASCNAGTRKPAVASTSCR